MKQEEYSLPTTGTLPNNLLVFFLWCMWFILITFLLFVNIGEMAITTLVLLSNAINVQLVWLSAVFPSHGLEWSHTNPPIYLTFSFQWQMSVLFTAFFHIFLLYFGLLGEIPFTLFTFLYCGGLLVVMVVSRYWTLLENGDLNLPKYDRYWVAK